MDEIRSWWEVPCIAHFCYIFRKPFKLPEFEIEELEDTLLLDCAPTPSALLVELYCTFLNGIVDKDITEDNWPFFLKLHIEWRCEYLKEKWNPFTDDKEYKDLSIRQRVEILHRLCHWRLELDDIADLVRGFDGPSLRLESLGKDSEGSHYWYFFGVRLYKEDSKKKKKENGTTTPAKKGRGKGGATPKTTPASKKKSTPANNRTPGGRRSTTRGRGSKKQEPEEDAESAACEEEGGENGTVEKDDIESVEEGRNGVTAASTATGWHIACSTLEEWEELVENLGGTKHQETRRLIRTLQEYLPDIERTVQQREKQFKKKMLAELPRRTSDRIAIKAAQKIEEERVEALAREQQRLEIRKIQAEEERLKQEEAEEKRRKRHDEAVQRRKRKQEEQARVRREEEENWEKALSGELSGPRKAALGAAEGVSDAQRLSQELQMQLVADRDEDLYTAMFKILKCLRAEEDAWVFEEPVTESIAPGYFDVVSKPMDYSTIEKKIESNNYKSKEEFASDVQLVFDNCIAYNGDDSEYSELAVTTKKAFEVFCKKHFEGEEPGEEGGAGAKGRKSRKKRDSRSPSACKTPELTSESSSEEEESEDDSDESYHEGKRPAKKSKGPQLKLNEALQSKLNNLDPGMRMGPMMPGARPPGHMPPGMMPPQFHPNYYQMMQQRFGGMKAPPLGAGADPMAFRYPPPHPHMPHSRLPPPYPGQPHPDMVARQHGMYQRPPPPPDGRHMYPAASGAGGPPGHHPPHYPPHSLPPLPHGYPPHYQMYPRHPHMPPYPPHAMGAGIRPPGGPPHPALSRPGSSGSPVLHSPPLRQTDSPIGANSRQTSSPAGSNPRLTASPAGSSTRRTESPADSHSSDQQQPPSSAPLALSQQLQGSQVASLLQQGRVSQKKEEQPPSGPQGEGKGEGEKEKRESTSSTEDGQSRGAEHTSNEKREKGSAEERGKKGRETGGEMVAAKSAGAEGQEPKRPSSAEMMHRQQLEYQRYRYHQHMLAMHQQRQQREGGAGMGPSGPGMGPSGPGGYPPFPPGPGYDMPPPHYGHAHQGGGGEREREAAAAAYYWHQQQQQHMFGGGGGDPRQMAEQQQRYWHEMEMRKRQHMAAMMKQHKMAQQQKAAQGSSKDGSAHQRPDGSAHQRGQPQPQENLSHQKHDESSQQKAEEKGNGDPPAKPSETEEGNEGEPLPSLASADRGESSDKEAASSSKSEGEGESSAETNSSAAGEDKKPKDKDGEPLPATHQDQHTGENADRAQKPSPEKQNKKSHPMPVNKDGGSHSHSPSRGGVPHSHSAPGYGGYGGHMSPHMMPNGYMEPPPHNMPGYHHPAMYPPYPPHPHTQQHMDPSTPPAMDYRNGFGGPSPYPHAGFYPPHHQRMPYYPSPPHSGGMPPYQMPPHHQYPQQPLDSRASSKSVAGSSPQLSAGMLPNTSLDAMATDGKSRRPPPTPPLDDEPPAKRSKIET